MRWCICVALLLAWPTRAAELSEIVPPLQTIERGLSLIDSSTTGISDYFESERSRLNSERSSLDAERLSLRQESERLARENDSLLARGLALTSRETALDKRGKSLDDREARIERVERIVKAAPWVALLVFAGGAVVGTTVF